MKEQLLRAWQTANAMNLLLLDHLGPESLQVGLSPRGRTVAQQLAHLNTVRMQWLQPGKKTEAGATDAASLRQSFTQTGALIEKLIDESWEKEGRVKGFSGGLLPFISYLIAHEAHHRGNILLSLKLSGIRLPDEVKWGLWEWK